MVNHMYEGLCLQTSMTDRPTGKKQYVSPIKQI